MNIWKHVLIVSLTVLLLCATLPAAFAAGVDGPVLRVEAGGAPRGGTAEVKIWLDSGTEVSGGSLDIAYDSASLELEKITQELSGVLMTVNEHYTNDSARLSFASTASLGQEGSVLLCTAVFQVKADAPLGENPVTLTNARLYDANVATLPVSTVDGAVEAQYTGITVSPVEAVRGQSVRVELLLEGALNPAGGSFEVVYDPALLTAGGVMAGDLLNGCSLASNTVSPGTLKVTWAGSAALEERGVLCTVTFQVSSTASGTPEIAIEKPRIYDENAAPLDALTESGIITLLTPTEESPKLWIVGGNIDPAAKTASVDVVLEGRGVICGGGFTVTYPTEGVTLVKASPLVSVGVVNTEPAGEITFTWAGAEPSVESQKLLHLEFSVTDPNAAIPLTLGAASALDSGGIPATVVDIRSGKLLPGGLEYQAPAVDEATVETAGGSTELHLVLDMASAGQTAVSRTLPERSLLVALYEDGRLQSAELQAFDVELDANGIAQVEVSAAFSGSGDELRLYLLGEGGALIPLSEQTSYLLEA